MLMLLFNDTHYHLHILLLLIGTRNELFTQYEGLCKRIIYLNNAKEDLTIKKEILERERARCENRSKFHSLVPPLISFESFQWESFLNLPNILILLPCVHKL